MTEGLAPMEPQDGFTHISVHVDDEDELVIHAGAARDVSGSAATRTDAAGPAVLGRQPDDAPAAGEGGEPAGPARHVAAAPARGPREPGAGPDGREELRRRAEELERAEEGLRDPHAFPRMRRAIIIVLAIAAAAFVIYTIFPR